MPLSGGRSDRFKPVYVVLAVAACMWWQGRSALDQQFGLFLALPLVIAVPLLVVVVTFAIALPVYLVQGRWKSAASLFFAIVFAWVLFAWLPINSVDWLIFELSRSNYKLVDTRVQVGVRMRAWLFRDEGAFGSAVTETYVVYDETDQIALPSNEWSDAWKSRAAVAGEPDRNFVYLVQPNNQYTPFGYRVNHLHGHWYLVALGF